MLPDWHNREMELLTRIVADPQILGGKPVIRGTRIAVELVLELLAAGESEEEILDDYPALKREDILACLSWAHYLEPVRRRRISRSGPALRETAMYKSET